MLVPGYIIMPGYEHIKKMMQWFKRDQASQIVLCYLTMLNT